MNGLILVVLIAGALVVCYFAFVKKDIGAIGKANIFNIFDANPTEHVEKTQTEKSIYEGVNMPSTEISQEEMQKIFQGEGGIKELAERMRGRSGPPPGGQ